MWLANALTMSRIPLAVVFWVTYGDLRWSLAIVGAAAITDALDGTLARRARTRGSRSTAGEWLDPLADKLFMLVVLGAIVVHEQTPWIIVVAICAREFVLVPLGIVYRFVGPRIEHAYKAGALGKATTIAQLAALTALVARAAWAPAIALSAGALGIAATVHYVARSLGHARLA